MILPWVVSLACGCLVPDDPKPVPPPAISARLERPDRVLERVISLFAGSPATDPAAALASWKRATGGTGSLGKGAEAGIAAMNPRMIPELATLHASTFALDFDPNGPAFWAFSVPRDDGAFAAFASAVALTDGASEPAIDGATVDRLGPPGAPWIATRAESVVVGNSRDAIAKALRILTTPHGDGDGERVVDPSEIPGVSFTIDAAGLSRSEAIAWRRVGDAMRALAIPVVKGHAGLADDQVSLVIRSPVGDAATIPRREVAWDRELSSQASLIFAMAVDASPKALERWFAAADAVEKADPANLRRNPSRTRLNLIASASRVNLERDVWPKIRGISGFAVGTAAAPEGIAVAFHMSDPASAAKLRTDVLPAMSRAFRQEIPPGKPNVLATVAGKSLEVMPDETSTVWVVWGGKAREELERVRRIPSLAIDSAAGSGEQTRLLVIHPNRLGLAPEGSPAGLALAEAPPIVWTGEVRDGQHIDRVTSSRFRPMIRRFLETIPQKSEADPGR